MKLPYSEGSVFLVPLKEGGYARGVVARVSPKGRAALGYFFGPRICSMDAIPFDDLCPAHAIKCILFGDLGLINGEWPIVAAAPNWKRAEWPMPDFARRDPLGRLKPTLVRYSDTDPTYVESEFAVDDDSGLETDSLSGCAAVEIKLTKLLGPTTGTTMRADDREAFEQLRLSSNILALHSMRHYLYFPHENAAANVAEMLCKQGFASEYRLGADDINWLVLAENQVVPSESTIVATCEFMDKVSRDNGGEYDGWEAAIQSVE